MLVRMTTGLAGPGLVLEPGQERDFPQAEAVRLVQAGFAVPVAEVKVERAVQSRAKDERRGRRASG